MSVSEEYVEEVENLKEIYIDDGFVVSNNVVEMTVKPEEDETLCFVAVTLHVEVPKEYPGCAANAIVRNPRGLSPQNTKILEGLLKRVAREMAETDSEAIYELIEETKTFLQDHNEPPSHCSICLEDRTCGDHTDDNNDVYEPLIKTPCYHFFHKNCIGRHFYFWRTDPQVVRNVHYMSCSSSRLHTLLLHLFVCLFEGSQCGYISKGASTNTL
eukprot:m.127169 g.127169  ORF g.127169 m.127169 type:complete len:214 (+) comp13001_c0_seq3:113-754(+)